MATFAFQMGAALSERWLGLSPQGGTHGIALGQPAISCFGDLRSTWDWTLGGAIYLF